LTTLDSWPTKATPNLEVVMAAERLSMRKLREALRLHFDLKLSAREIAKSCQTSPSTVLGYLGRAKVVKLTWPLPPEMDDDALARLLFPSEGQPVKSQPEPNFSGIHLELRRKHVTLQLLWEEYREAHADGYQYSQFCDLYMRWASKLNPTMRQTHRAGEKTFVDFSGDGLTIADPQTGECQSAPLFVAALGASNLTWAEPTLCENLPTWLGCHVHAFEFFEGVTEIVVPDNLRSGVTKPHLYEPEVNFAYLELARHYGVAVVPARKRKPRDKAKVEQAVLLAERWILACLRDHVFFSLEEARQAVRKLVDKLNDRPMRRLKKSRRQVFEELERSALKPLPPTPYELSQWQTPRVNIDYHVVFEDHFYSVPYGLVHELVDLRATQSVVEIFFKGLRITSHLRSFEKGKATTKPEHMPSSHRAHAEWTPSRILEWAKKTGPSAATLAEEIMRRRPHPENGFRSCLGIIRLGERYGPERLERACARAVRFRAFSYASVEAILKNNLDRADEAATAENQKALPRHGNVRGGTYYH
jgi:transposase